MFYFNPYAIPQFVTSITALLMGVTILKRDHRNTLNLTLFVWNFSIFLWLGSYTLCFSTISPKLALYMSRFACFSVLFMCISAFHFVITFLNLKKYTIFAKIGYALTIITSPIYLFSNHGMYAVKKHFFGYFGLASKYYFIFIIFDLFYVISALIFLILAIKEKQLSGIKLIRTKYLFFGFAIAAIANLDYLPKYNFDFYPPGAFFSLFWLLIISYAILKHKLLDITIVIKRGVIYSLLISTISIILILTVIISENIFKNIIGYSNIFSTIIAATIIAIIFIPLRNWIQSFIEKYIFKGSVEEIAEQNEYLRGEAAEKEKFQAVATLASGIAHEVRNPITSLKTFFEYFPEKKNDPEFLEKFNRIGQQEFGRIEKLITQLLNFAKPSPLEFKECNINQLIEETLTLISNKLITNNITVNKQPATNNQQLKCDQGQLKQVFLNIFLNAIDAMEEGGQLTIETQLKALGLRSWGLGKTHPSPPNTQHLTPNTLTTIIKDTGPGMTKQALKKAFDPFFTTKTNGTGLGLAICKQIIEKHQGRINVESIAGVGTTFEIELPIN